MNLIDPLLRSPRLPQYLRELENIMETERAARQCFFKDAVQSKKTEFINGKIVQQSPITLEHISVSDDIMGLMATDVLKHNFGFVGAGDLMISLTRNDYEPDIYFFNATTSAAFTPDQVRFPAPDLAIKVLSPRTKRNDRTIKFEDYAAHGVDEYWIVDPREQTIEQYPLAGDGYKLAVKIKDGNMQSRAVMGFEMPVRAAFDSQIHLETLGRMLQTKN